MSGSASPLAAKRFALLAVKLLSLALLSFYSFGIIYVLVRTVPPDFYPWMVLLSSVGGYVLATDLGFSVYVYSVVRRMFLSDGMRGLGDMEELVSEAMAFYLLIAAAAAAIAALVIPLFAPPGLAIALCAYFASIVLPLPWMLLRRAAAALDLYLEMETLECVRRALACVLAGAMLAGVSLQTFAFANLILWGVAMVMARALMARHGFVLRRVAIGRALGFVARNRAGVMMSGSFTGLEFLIFNYPYLAIPIVFHGPANLVAFDVFAKVTRFGSTAFSVMGEVLTPPQTRCFYAGDAKGVVRFQRLIGAAGLVPLAGACILLIVGGGPLFERLLAGVGSVGPSIRVAMMAMLAALLLQTVSGGFLIAVGRYGPVTRVALLSAALMAAMVAMVALTGASFSAFMLAYVAVFAVHAVLCQRSFTSVVAAIEPETGRIPIRSTVREMERA